MPVNCPIEPAPLLAAVRTGHEPLQSRSIDRILHSVREHLGMEIAFVSRYLDDGMKELTHVDSDLDLPMGPGFRDPREDSYCWHILEGRLPELIQDPADHPFTQTMAITKFLPVGVHLNTPLRLSDGTPYGSFCCLSRAPDRTITERDLGVLRAFATLASEQIEASLEDSANARRSSDRIEKILGSDGGLRIVHQPIVALADGRGVGVESLARFPDAGQRGPDQWFKEASEIGRGVDLELHAARGALDTVSAIPKHCYLSINASPDAILSGRLHELLADRAPGRVVVELTEHQEVSDFRALRDALRNLSQFARIAIDDVGAGYAGLRHLVDLSPDLLKLDVSLTRDIHLDVARQALAAAMVRFSAAIGSQLVAEGIERAEEAAVLADLGVPYAQGYFFARPMPVTEASRFLRDSSIH